MRLCEEDERLNGMQGRLSVKKFFLILIIAAIVIPSIVLSLQQKQQSGWYDNLIFKNENFSFQLARTLGYAYSGGADIGEVLKTAKAIKPENIDAWYMQWLKTANRIYRFAETSQRAGHIVSAREAYFRASNYYRTAGFYMESKDRFNKSISSWKLSRKSFLKAIASLPYIKVINIPYEKTLLPGYFIKSPEKNAPLLIVHTGYDGTAEELYFEVGVAAHQRGYNILLFEGPGQGGVLRIQKLPFRADWEKVVTPVIDFALTLPGVNKNKIALLGISFGGYLAPRACAFDHRISACIANGGIYSVVESFYKRIPPKVIPMISAEPEAFNKTIYEIMQKDPQAQFFFNHGMRAFGAKSPADFMLKLKQYNLKDVAKNIKCPTLILDSESDAFLKGEAKKLYDVLNAPKTYYLFTKRQAAQAHIQVGAIAISNEIIFNWLDGVFK